MRVFLLPSLPTVAQYKPSTLGVSVGIYPKVLGVDTPIAAASIRVMRRRTRNGFPSRNEGGGLLQCRISHGRVCSDLPVGEWGYHSRPHSQKYQTFNGEHYLVVCFAKL